MSKSWFPTIDEGRCRADCNICVNFCPSKVYKKGSDKTFVAFPDKCIDGCSNCKKICPEGAITFIKARMDFFTIDGEMIGIVGVEKAIDKSNFNDFFKEISKYNYIPEKAKPEYVCALKEFYRSRKFQT